MLRAAVVAIFLAASVSPMFGANRPIVGASNQPEHQPNQKQNSPDNRGTDKIPLIVKILPGERTKEEEKEARKKSELDRKTADYTRDLAFYTKCLFGATLLLAALTGALALAAFLQMREGRKAITAAEDAAKAASASAKSTADLASAAADHAGHADRAVKVSETAAQRQLRAYVYPERINSYPNDSELQPVINFESWTFYVVWKNWGHTPTKNMVIFNARSIAPFPLPHDFGYRVERGLPEATSLPPQGIMHGMPFTIPIAIMEEIRTEQRSLYLWGWVEYDDVFVETPRHRSEYCMRVEVAGDLQMRECSFRFRRIGPHNGTDDECLHKPQTTTEDATSLRQS